MSVSMLIDKVMGKQREREEARAADFQGIVRQIATGTEPDPDRVDAVLADAEKTLDDLRDAVEQLLARRKLRERFDEIPQLMAERKEVEKRLAEADDVLAEAEKTHTDVTLPLLARMDELRQACWDAEAAKAELLQTCSDPVLLAQMEDIEEQINLLQENHTNLQQAIADHRSQAESEHARAEQAKRIVHGEEQVKEHQRKAKWCERTANGCAAQLARVEKEIAKLERQQQAVREQMLVP